MAATDDKTDRSGVCHRVVMDLKIPWKGHCVYVDYYTSPQLLLDLLSKGTPLRRDHQNQLKGISKRAITR